MNLSEQISGYREASERVTDKTPGQVAAKTVAQCFRGRFYNLAKAIVMIVLGIMLLITSVFWLLAEPIAICFRARYKPQPASPWN